jgi:diguanylate cyclase (GGDEF)-like protein
VQNIVEESLRAIERLTIDEKKILADFERRISVLSEHERIVGIILSAIEKLSRSDFKKNEDFQRTKRDLIFNLNLLMRLLHDCFSSFRLPEIMSDDLNQSHKIIEKRITDDHNLYFHFEKKSNIVYEKIEEDLRALLGIENQERLLIETFIDNLNSFKNIILSLEKQVSSELLLLQEICNSINQDKFDNFIRWKEALTESHKQIERYLYAEDKVVHKYLDALLRNERRATRLARQLLRGGQITVEDIDKAVKTFHSAQQHLDFYNVMKEELGELEKRNLINKRARRAIESVSDLAGRQSAKENTLMGYLEKIAYEDKLTGLLNRRGLLKSAERLISQCHKNGKILSLLMIDLDHFKQYNDRYSHSAGDDILRYIGGFLKANCKTSDVVGRWGGEEFIILFYGIDKKLAEDIANAIRTKLESESNKLKQGSIMNHVNSKYTLLKGKPFDNITLSIGVSSLEEFSELQTLIHEADKRLYKAKQKGRNMVVSEG